MDYSKELQRQINIAHFDDIISDEEKKKFESLMQSATAEILANEKRHD